MATLYKRGNEMLAKGLLSFGSNQINLVLMTNAYTPDAVNDSTLADISANEVATGEGYTSGVAGLEVQGKSVSEVSDTVWKWDASNVVWTAGAGGLTARYAVLVKYNATVGLSDLIAYEDFGTDQTRTSGPFTINFNGEILRSSI